MWERNRLASLIWEKTGKPVKDSDEFWLATNDYLASGGDNTGHIFDDIPTEKQEYLEISSRDVVADYLRQHPGIHWQKKFEPRIVAIP